MHPPRSKPGKSSTVQAKHLQDASFLLAMKIKQDIESSTSASSRIRLASAWRAVVQSFDTAAERRRILQGKGLPKYAEPVPSKSKRSPAIPEQAVSFESTSDQDKAA